MAQSVRGPVPLYVQIAGLLRARLEAGEWRVGDKLPSIGVFAETLEVAPDTLRQALVILEDEGLVQRRQGHGTIVLSEPRDRRWLPLPTDWPSLVKMLEKLEPKLTLIEDKDSTPRNAEGEGELLSSYKYLKRVHYRDDKPFCIIDFYLSSELFMKSPKSFRTGLVIPLLDQMPDLGIGKVRQQLYIDVADAASAKLLDIPIAGAIARVRRTITDTEGRLIYLADVIYRGDVVVLDMDLSPSKAEGTHDRGA